MINPQSLTTLNMTGLCLISAKIGQNPSLPDSNASFWADEISCDVARVEKVGHADVHVCLAYHAATYSELYLRASEHNAWNKDI